MGGGGGGDKPLDRMGSEKPRMYVAYREGKCLLVIVGGGW